jgi:hypothetical protein
MLGEIVRAALKVPFLSTVVVLLAVTGSTRAQGAEPVEARFSDQGHLLVAGSITGYWSNDNAWGGVEEFADWHVNMWPTIQSVSF